MTHGRLHLDQVAHWADLPVLRARAVPTGMHSNRIITVAPLHLVVMTVVDSYEPTRTNAFRTVEDALTEADRIMSQPDSRGQLRDWVLGDAPSGETLAPGTFGPA